jgi:hypothetical protein
MESTPAEGRVLTEKLAMPKCELSCFIGNLFAELDPPCGVMDDDAVVIHGRTVTGSYAKLKIIGDVVYFEGHPSDLDSVKNGRCPKSAECKSKKE